jgi:hypothetical protein
MIRPTKSFAASPARKRKEPPRGKPRRLLEQPGTSIVSLSRISTRIRTNASRQRQGSPDVNRSTAAGRLRWARRISIRARSGAVGGADVDRGDGPGSRPAVRSRLLRPTRIERGPACDPKSAQGLRAGRTPRPERPPGSPAAGRRRHPRLQPGGPRWLLAHHRRRPARQPRRHDGPQPDGSNQLRPARHPA